MTTNRRKKMKKQSHDNPAAGGEQDELKQAFKSINLNDLSNSNKNEKLKLTKEEVERFEKAFEQKEFRDLMAQYVSEISDPKHRAEQDEYIRQLEEQNEIPSGKDIIRPEPGFVLKFKFLKITKGTSGAQKQEEHHEYNEKLFVNVVHSKLVAQPTYATAETKDKDGKVGRNWSIPYTLGPMRMEADNRKSLIPTFDCCFHPLSLLYASKNVSFRDMIASTISQAIKKQFKAVNEDILIDNNYHIIKGTQYKNGKPPVMMIDKDKEVKSVPLKDTKSGRDPPLSSSSKHSSYSSNTTGQEDEDKKTLISSSKQQQPQQQEVLKKSSSMKKGFLLNKQTTKSSKTIKTKDENASSVLFNKGGGLSKEGSIIPHYEIIERGEFEIADHTIQGLNQPSSRPKQLILRVNLPGIQSAKYVNLDVSEERLVLKSLESNPTYHLNMKLPYPVLNEEGTAKFDKDKHVLTITIPVCRPDIIIHDSTDDVAKDEGGNDLDGCGKIAKDIVENEEKDDISADDPCTPAKTVRSPNTALQSSDVVDHLNDSPVIVSISPDHSRWIDTSEQKSQREDFARDESLPTLPKPKTLIKSPKENNISTSSRNEESNDDDRHRQIVKESNSIDCDSSFELVEHINTVSDSFDEGTKQSNVNEALRIVREGEEDEGNNETLSSSLYRKSQLIFELD